MLKKILISISMCGSLLLNAQDQPPKDWWLKAPKDGYRGVQSYKTYDELLKTKTSKTVVVAIIDSGIDVEHEDLAGNIWINQGEIAKNGIDDDKNGYIDDINGWNFIGGPKGQNVGPDSYEATRVYGRLKYKYDAADPGKLNKEQKEEYAIYLKVKEEVESKRSAAEKSITQIDAVKDNLFEAIEEVAALLVEKGLSLKEISTLDQTNTAVTTVSNIMGQLSASEEGYSNVGDLKDDLTEALKEEKKRFEDQLAFAYNTEFDPRKTIVKDNYSDQLEKSYGNNDVEGPDASHGTHVAGIIGMVADNEFGIEGVAKNVKLMSVRAVPDGDERDKDVANAIRYAVDNGAQVVNMSFGKGYSWNEKIVEDAIAYAEKNDVLLVHAAGNSAQNNDITNNFPNSTIEKRALLFFKKKKPASNWVEVGALSYKDKEDAVATFSNYGKKNVDLFAPGVKIYSTTPNNEYASFQGTSMASPTVAGVAAVLRSYYPTLTAQQIKQIIMQSSTPITDTVKVPGTKGEKKVSFSELSVSGGIVNLYDAVKIAEKTKGKKKLPKTNSKGA